MCVYCTILESSTKQKTIGFHSANMM